mmetsp:Transcript_3935/g.7562  ORF Transcript_3935/g.7562 Transcript_3935/m.7562 type:complete len:940 (-) Transcript_3935:2963-5782(-)
MQHTMLSYYYPRKRLLFIVLILALEAGFQDAFVITKPGRGGRGRTGLVVGRGDDVDYATTTASTGGVVIGTSVTRSLSNSSSSSNSDEIQIMSLPDVVSFFKSISVRIISANANAKGGTNPLESSQNFYLEALQREKNITRFATHGYITHRRSFGSSFAFIDLVDVIDKEKEEKEHEQNSQKSWTQSPLQAMIKIQDHQHHRSKSSFASILKSLYPGTRVYLEGVPCGTRNPGEVVLLVQYLRFEMCSRNPQHVKGLLMKMSKYLIQTQEEKEEEGKEEEVSGICMDDVVDVFGSNINANALKNILKGQEGMIDGDDDDVESILYPPVAGAESRSKQQQQQQQQQQRQRKNHVLLESMARAIVKNLPQDSNYPFELLLSLNQKGGGQGSKNARATWVNVPENVKEIPSGIQATLKQTTQENGIAHEISICNLLDKVTNHNYDTNTMDLFTIEGWVQNRKRFQGSSRNESITILELVDDEVQFADDNMSDLVDGNRLKCVLHPNCCLGGIIRSDKVTPTHAYGHLLGKGSKAILQGYCAVDAMSQRPIFWVKEARLARSTWHPSILKYLFDLIAGSNETGKYSFGAEEIASALDVGYQKAESLINKCLGSDATERQWLAAEFSGKLQNESSRNGCITDKMNQVLDQYASIRNEYPLEKIERDDITISKENFDNVQMLRRRRTASLKQSTEGSRWSSKKRPQLEFMAQQVKEVVESHADFGSRPLNILDVGGGRGYLSNYLSMIFGTDVATVHVIDIDSRAIKNGLVDAKRKGLKNVYYGVGDASSSSDVAKLVENETYPNYDIIVALHACGALSDVALGHAVSNAASFVITPCCFMSNPFLRVALSPRLGQDEKTVKRPCEWLGLEEENMLALTKAAELQGDMAVAGEAIHSLCALRARAVKRYWSETNSEYLDIRIKTFPIEFSTRNYCIVGKIIASAC